MLSRGEGLGPVRFKLGDQELVDAGPRLSLRADLVDRHSQGPGGDAAEEAEILDGEDLDALPGGPDRSPDAGRTPPTTSTSVSQDSRIAER